MSRPRGRRAAQMALIIVVTAVCGSAYAVLGDNGLMAVMRMRARAAQLRYDIAAKERANDELTETIKPLRDGDPDAVEKLARERLNMGRPGDTIFLLPPEARSPEPTVEAGNTASPTAPPLSSRR